MRIGAWVKDDGNVEFTVWAPAREHIELCIESTPTRVVSMKKDRDGYWSLIMPGLAKNTLYRYRLDGKATRPDPASLWQPNGVHKASCIVDHRDFVWTDGEWAGADLDSMVLYELHVGTFTENGTFDDVIPRLAELKGLGITAIEIMPVAQFPGERNWGYDGVYPFAVQSSYGGPGGFKRLVNACHQSGLSVVLDVVYNHLGPEGNYLQNFGPYFTDRYQTGWGPAVNFDGPGSDQVRNYFIENAIHWLRDYHIDALRVDAVHAIFDMSAVVFLEELTSACHEYGRSVGKRIAVIAETHQNDAKIIRRREEHGYGFDAFWSDDFHHAIHTILTGEKGGYYVDYGSREQLARCLKDGMIYTGQFSRFRGRRHGNAATHMPPQQFVVCSQNHDQVGNRMGGERLCHLVSFEAAKTAASLVILAPYTPLLLMGEEYAETAPFPFFVSHSDHDLIEAVRKGRREEFRTFDWTEEPPDPQDPMTFRSAKLHWNLRTNGIHQHMIRFYAELLRLRREEPALRNVSRESFLVDQGAESKVVFLVRWNGESRVLIGFNITPHRISSGHPGEGGQWRKILDSEDSRWGNPALTAPDALLSGQNMHLHPFQTVAYMKD
jgi:maltooligosyltrehalose trehalohydrolase